MPEGRFVGDMARNYDRDTAAMATPEVLEPTVDCLLDLAEYGPVLEFAIGTGRVAIPLAARGVDVTGIELSADMLAELSAKPEAVDITAVEGDMATARVDGEFSLVYLVFNTISNLTTQAEQVACFENAARHLRPGGRFVVENGVPDLRRLPPGNRAVPFTVSDDYLGIDEYTDLTHRQLFRSRHLYRRGDGSFAEFWVPFRFVWPSELDLMARLAGMTLEHRWPDWNRSPFDDESTSAISVWRLGPQRRPGPISNATRRACPATSIASLQTGAIAPLRARYMTDRRSGQMFGTVMFRAVGRDGRQARSGYVRAVRVFPDTRRYQPHLRQSAAVDRRRS